MKYKKWLTVLLTACLVIGGTALVGAVNIDKSQPKNDSWKLEKLAIQAFMKQFHSSHHDVDVKKLKSKKNGNGPIDLQSIGKNITAEELLPLEGDDFQYGQYVLGDIYNGPNQIDQAAANKKNESISETSILSISKNDQFTSYHSQAADITVYTGPDQARLINQQLRGQGAVYFYPFNSISDIHIKTSNYKTVRDIHVGSSRGEVLFSYGIPNALWRDDTHKNIIFLYEGTSLPLEKQGNLQSLSNNNSKDNITGQNVKSQSLEAKTNKKRYLVFTFEEDTVKGIDMIDGQVWPRLGLPNVSMHHFKPGQLEADDFVLRGLSINEIFKGDGDSSWTAQGTLNGNQFIGYSDYGVSFDKANKISCLVLNGNSSTTRRGIGIGDTKYLLLYTYGMPTHIEQHGVHKVYEYKNPRSETSYLLFTMDKDDKFIDMVMLSDRPSSRLK